LKEEKSAVRQEHWAAAAKCINENAITRSPDPNTFVGEAYRDSVLLSRSKFFDQAVIKLMRPFSEKECDDLFSADDEFSPITPPALGAVGERS
jgi:hypothetical protein